MKYKTNDDMLICELAKDGMPVDVIAEKMELAVSEVLATCVDYLIQIDKKGFIYPAIERLIIKGMSVAEITEKLDCTPQQVYIVRHRLGIKKPKAIPDCMLIRCKMACKLVTDGMTISEACKNVKVSTRDFSNYKKALVVS